MKEGDSQVPPCVSHAANLDRMCHDARLCAKPLCEKLIVCRQPAHFRFNAVDVGTMDVIPHCRAKRKETYEPEEQSA